MIAIRDFKMPKDCDGCPFYTYYNDNADDCRITGEIVQNVKPGERHPKCPLVDIEPVKTGHWIDCCEKEPFYRCSECKEKVLGSYRKFCPNCGARM